MTSSRMLIIGFDAATPDLVGPWMDEGRLPTLRRLAETGAWGPLRSVPNMASPAAWSTFATGKNPGRHGVFFFTERIPGTYQERFVNGSMRDGTAFWHLLGGESLRVGVMNVPLTFPAEAVNGFFISGLDAPDVEHPNFAHPRGLMKRLHAELGGFVAAGSMSAAVGHDVVAGRYDVALRTLLERMETRTRWAEHLIAQERPDVMVVVYTETDAAAHFFWKLMDQRHPDWSAEAASRWGDALLRVYQKADEATARLMKAYGESTVMLVSDHGAGITNDAYELTRTVLREAGLLVHESDRGGRRALQRGAATALYRWVTPRLPMAVRDRLRQSMPGVVGSMKSEVRGRVDWTRSQAYAMGAPGEVWVNVRGREPAGMVEPGQQYEEVRQRIAEAFRSCVHTATGRPVVKEVLMREQMYSGPHAERGPDLFVLPDDAYCAGYRVGDREVVVPRRLPANPREAMSGTHRPDGVLFLHGPGIAPGASLHGAQLQDVAPTALYASGAAVPDDMDGTVLSDAFTPEHRATHPVRHVAAQGNEGGAVHTFTDEEAAAIESRLRNLGYL